MQDEIFDVVNDADEVVGTATRREVHENSLLHRAMFILFLKGDTAILQKRSSKVEHSAGALGSTAAGHLLAGETYEQGLLRECAEETGWLINSKNAHFLGKLRHKHSDAYGGKVHDVFHAFFVYEFEADASELIPDGHEVESFVAYPLEQILNPKTITVPYSLALSEESTLAALKKYLEARHG